MTRWHRDVAERRSLRHATEDAKSDGQGKTGREGRGSRTDSTDDESKNEMVNRVARYRFDCQVEPELLQPPNPRRFVWFWLICSRGESGGSIAAAVTLDTVADEGRSKMADGMTRSPAKLCIRDGKICFYERLEYDFLLVHCFLHYLSSFAFSLYVSIFFVFLCLCRSSNLLMYSQHVRIL